MPTEIADPSYLDYASLTNRDLSLSFFKIGNKQGRPHPLFTCVSKQHDITLSVILVESTSA
jgi:hypothetical protein